MRRSEHLARRLNRLSPVAEACVPRFETFIRHGVKAQSVRLLYAMLTPNEFNAAWNQALARVKGQPEP